jgi:hypothetical protein
MVVRKSSKVNVHAPSLIWLWVQMPAPLLLRFHKLSWGLYKVAVALLPRKSQCIYKFNMLAFYINIITSPFTEACIKVIADAKQGYAVVRNC